MVHLLRGLLPVCALVLLTVACDQNEPASAADPAVSPETIQYPVHAAHANYVYFDEVGEKVLAPSLGEVPEPIRALATVSIGEKTRAPDGMVYVFDPSASDDRVAVARLRDTEKVARDTDATWLAFDIGSATWENASVVAQFVHEDVGPTKKRKNRRRSQEPSAPKTNSIEIVTLSGVEPSTRGSSASTSVRAVRGWKPVTFYSTKSCGVCSRARKWFRANNVPVKEYDIDENRGARIRWRAALSKERLGGGVPTFVIGSERKVMQGWDADRFVEAARR